MSLDSKTIGIFLVVIGLVVVGSSYFKHGTLSGHNVECDVELMNFPALPTSINSYDCQVKEACIMNPLDIIPTWWEDRGVITLTIGTATMVTDYVVYESLYESYSFTLERCVPDGTHDSIIKITDDNGVLIDSEEFTMEV